MPLSEAASGRSSRFAWWITVGVCLMGMAVVSVLGAFAVHQACYHPPPSIGRVIPGTPRGEYCARVESFHLWPFLIGVPMLLTGLALLVGWCRMRIAFTLTALIAAAVLINALVVHELQASVTI